MGEKVSFEGRPNKEDCRKNSFVRTSKYSQLHLYT